MGLGVQESKQEVINVASLFKNGGKPTKCIQADLGGRFI